MIRALLRLFVPERPADKLAKAIPAYREAMTKEQQDGFAVVSIGTLVDTAQHGIPLPTRGAANVAEAN